jgi:predicted DNA-binding transcriptional regulator YafY
VTNQTNRVLELLKRFNNNQKVCIDSLSNEFLWEGKSEKTIRRDLNIIKAIFPESFELIKGNKGCYKAITKKSFDNFMNPKNISLMIQTFNMAQRSNLFDSLDIDTDDKVILLSKIEDVKKLYEFKNKPFETITNEYEVFRKLETSIYHTKSINIEYQTTNKVITIEVKPYKILYMNENFYLACEVDNDKFQFSLYRIGKIKKIEDTSKIFQKKLEINNFIKDIQTPFAKYSKNYKEKMIKVELEVNSEKAMFFKSKKFLTSQKILKEKENGNLIVEYTITQEREVDELIKKWVPYVDVLSPLSIKRNLLCQLKQYIVNNDT